MIGLIYSNFFLINVFGISTSSKTERIREFLDAENLPNLTAEEIEAIDVAGKKLHKRIFAKHVFNDSN